MKAEWPAPRHCATCGMVLQQPWWDIMTAKDFCAPCYRQLLERRA